MRSWRGPTLALLLVGTAPLLPANIGGPYGPMCPVPSEQVISSDKEPERLIASLLTIGLGAFGAHRLYLGTSAKVPIVYGLTFGGFGVLAAIDLGHILFTKDLSAYRRNEQVFMWAGPPRQLTPP
ncbi:MAG: TM2 domain-containing protein [Flavobacteriales bacterium]|nr:TM2 domain-containing protein [Flavobacteriales bacterium]